MQSSRWPAAPSGSVRRSFLSACNHVDGVRRALQEAQEDKQARLIYKYRSAYLTSPFINCLGESGDVVERIVEEIRVGINSCPQLLIFTQNPKSMFLQIELKNLTAFHIVFDFFILFVRRWTVLKKTVLHYIFLSLSCTTSLFFHPASLLLHLSLPGRLHPSIPPSPP